MAKEIKQDSPLVEHAKRELALAGIDRDDGDYNGAIAKAVMVLVQDFADQRHSGASAELTASIFYTLVQFRPLTPLSDDPNEWQDVTEVMYTEEQRKEGLKMWQSKRSSSVFSKDGGATWIDKATGTEGQSISKEDLDSGNYYTTEDQQRKQEASGVSGGSTPSEKTDTTSGVPGQSATESSEASSGRTPDEPGKVARRERGVEGTERPDSKKSTQTGAQNPTSSGTPGEKGGKKA